MVVKKSIVLIIHRFAPSGIFRGLNISVGFKTRRNWINSGGIFEMRIIIFGICFQFLGGRDGDRD